MKTLGKTLRLKNMEGDVGIEIELVGRYLPQSDEINSFCPLWRRDEDNSLKGPETGEYVLKAPVPIKEVKKQLQYLEDLFKTKGTRLQHSITAGTHVHVNVQGFTAKQIITFVCSYLILEEMLVDWCEPERRGNHFCLRASDAEYLIHLITTSIERNDYSLLNTECIRYSSINLMSLFKYGSVEFRSLEGTGNFDKINTWANILHTLKKNSLSFPSPIDLFNKVSAEDYSLFLSSLLGEYSEMFKVGDWREKIKRGIYLCQDIAFSRDWDQKDLNIFRIKGGYNFD